MAKASDNLFPYVHLTPAAAPASPAAGAQRLYLDSGDGNKLKRKDSTGTVTTIEGGIGGAESFDAALGALTGKVHRWKFDEAAGATVADSIGSLNLTLSGTYTRNVTGLSGAATTFGASAAATSSGLGSLPVGGNPFTLLTVYKTATVHQTQMILCAYGASGARTNIGLYMNSSSTASDAGGFNGSDNFRIPNVLPADTAWHMIAVTYESQFVKSYHDGIIYGAKLGGVQNTTASGNFVVGQGLAAASPFLGDIDEVVAFNRALSKRELDRLYRTLAAA